MPTKAKSKCPDHRRNLKRRTVFLRPEEDAALLSYAETLAEPGMPANVSSAVRSLIRVHLRRSEKKSD